MSSLKARFILSALIIAAAGILVTGDTAAAGSAENDPVCSALGCAGGSRLCASIEIPVEGCEDPEVMCCPEPEYKYCNEAKADLE
jgi:hypothetical protein